MKSNILKIYFLILNMIGVSQSFGQTKSWCRNDGVPTGACYAGYSYREVVSQNYIYVVGAYCSGTSQFGTKSLTSTTGGFFMAKYDAASNLIWVKHAGGGIKSRDCSPRGIIADAGGKLYVTGYFTDTTIIGNDTLKHYGDNIFIASFDSSGKALWATAAYGVRNAEPADIDINAAGELLITGKHEDSLVFGTTVLKNTVGTFIAKYSTSGTMLWAKSINTSGQPSVTSISSDEQNNIYVAGNFSSGFNTPFGYLSPVGATDIYVIKYNTAGNTIWQKKYGDVNTDYVGAIKVYKNALFMTGGYYYNTKLDTVTIPPSNGVDLFIARFDTSGKSQWAKMIQCDGQQQSEAWKITVDKFFSTYVTGITTGDITVGSTKLISIGSGGDAFLAKYRADGTPIYGALSSGRTGLGVALDNAGSVYVVSYLSGTGSRDQFYLCKFNNTVTAIDENALAYTSLYPNPTTGKFILSLSRPTHELEVKIFDSIGRNVYQTIIQGAESEIDPGNLLPGIYFVRITDSENQFTQKMIVH